MTRETWRLNQVNVGEGKRHDGLMTDEQGELYLLRRENRNLLEEREILNIRDGSCRVSRLSPQLQA